MKPARSSGDESWKLVRFDCFRILLREANRSRLFVFVVNKIMHLIQGHQGRRKEEENSGTVGRTHCVGLQGTVKGHSNNT